MAAETTRVKDIPTTATTAAADDYVLLDGATSGTRKGLASNLITASAAAAVAGLWRMIMYSYSWSNTTPLIVGTGYSTSTDHFCQVESGSTAGSSAKLSASDLYQVPQFKGGAKHQASMDNPFYVTVPVTKFGTSTAGIARFALGKVQATGYGALSALGFSAEIRGSRIWLVVHDGAVRTEKDSGVDIVDNTTTAMTICRTATAFELSVNGVPCVSIPKGAIGLCAYGSGFSVEAGNVGDSLNCAFVFGMPSIVS